MVCLKSLLSRISVLINYTMQSSNHCSTSSCFPRFLWSRFSGFRFFRVQYFKVQVFQTPDFCGSRFFRVQVFQSSRFSGSGSKVRVQVLEVAGKKCKCLKNGNDFEYKIKSIFHYLSRVLRFTKKSVLNFQPNAQPALLVQSQQSKHQNNV